ncbi:hypothetical protein NMY22_g17875 [Coprinellus aureogranulatus]|nr:hypothetical protein NMY22_g17875 [Coprinellus aureogranulatus]
MDAQVRVTEARCGKKMIMSCSSLGCGFIGHVSSGLSRIRHILGAYLHFRTTVQVLQGGNAGSIAADNSRCFISKGVCAHEAYTLPPVLPHLLSWILGPSTNRCHLFPLLSHLPDPIAVEEVSANRLSRTFETLVRTSILIVDGFSELSAGLTMGCCASKQSGHDVSGVSDIVHSPPNNDTNNATHNSTNAPAGDDDPPPPYSSRRGTAISDGATSSMERIGESPMPPTNGGNLPAITTNTDGPSLTSNTNGVPTENVGGGRAPNSRRTSAPREDSHPNRALIVHPDGVSTENAGGTSESAARANTSQAPNAEASTALDTSGVGVESPVSIDGDPITVGVGEAAAKAGDSEAPVSTTNTRLGGAPTENGEESRAGGGGTSRANLTGLSTWTSGGDLTAGSGRVAMSDPGATSRALGGPSMANPGGSLVSTADTRTGGALAENANEVLVERGGTVSNGSGEPDRSVGEAARTGETPVSTTHTRTGSVLVGSEGELRTKGGESSTTDPSGALTRKSRGDTKASSGGVVTPNLGGASTASGGASESTSYPGGRFESATDTRASTGSAGAGAIVKREEAMLNASEERISAVGDLEGHATSGAPKPAVGGASVASVGDLLGKGSNQAASGTEEEVSSVIQHDARSTLGKGGRGRRNKETNASRGAGVVGRSTIVTVQGTGTAGERPRTNKGGEGGHARGEEVDNSRSGNELELLRSEQRHPEPDFSSRPTSDIPDEGMKGEAGKPVERLQVVEGVKGEVMRAEVVLPIEGGKDNPQDDESPYAKYDGKRSGVSMLPTETQIRSKETWDVPIQEVDDRMQDGRMGCDAMKEGGEIEDRTRQRGDAAEGHEGTREAWGETTLQARAGQSRNVRKVTKPQAVRPHWHSGGTSSEIPEDTVRNPAVVARRTGAGDTKRPTS